MEREREVEEIWRWLRGSKIKKKLMLPNKEMVVKEKSEKYQSDFRKWDQNEKMKQYHYLQKGIKKISSSNPPPFWGQNRFLMPAFGWWLQPFAPCTHSQAHTALLPCQPGTTMLLARLWAEPKSTSVLPKHSCVNLQITSSPLLMHCLPLFHIFSLKVYVAEIKEDICVWIVC